MADNSAVGGMQPFGDRYGPAAQPHRDRTAPRERRDPSARGDQVELSDGQNAAQPLLRERVIAATRRALGAPVPPPGAIFAAPQPQSPAVAVWQIRREQRWLAATVAGELQAVLLSAFRTGLEEAAAILRDVGRFDADVAAWFAAVAAVLDAANA